MIWLHVREPVSAWTHFAGMVLALPTTWMMWRFSRGDALKRLALLVFGVSLAFCYGASWLYHSAPPEVPEWMSTARMIDHVGIYLLIAGTVTPIGLIALRGRWRIGLVGGMWALALMGISLRLVAEQPLGVLTLIYLFMGWMGCTAYLELARRLTHARVRPIWLGGLLYSAGAIINGVPWPGWHSAIFGPHEVFHLLVMAGSAAHCYFMWAVLLPYQRSREASGWGWQPRWANRSSTRGAASPPVDNLVLQRDEAGVCLLPQLANPQ
jgi:hemolysin III